MNTRKILISLLLSVLILSITTIGFCQSVDPGSLRGNVTGDTAQKINSTANQIIGIVQVIAVAAAVIMLIYLGIKYMSAAPSEKADIKKSAVIYVVGAVLLFATTGILGLIKTFATGVTGTVGGPSIPADPSTDSNWTQQTDGTYMHGDGTIIEPDGNGGWKVK